MADTVGTGVIIVGVLWLVSIALLIVFCSAQGKLKLVGLGPLIISAIVTIVLLSLPRGKPPNDVNPPYKYSFVPIIWIIIFTSLILSLVFALIAYFLTDVLEPRYAKVSNKGYRQIK